MTTLSQEILNAVSNGDVSQLRQVLKIDMNIMDEYGNTPLIIAVENNDIEMVRELLNNPCIGDIDLEIGDAGTPLLLASRNGNLDIAKILLEAGAKLDDLENMGFTSLMSASLYNHPDIVELLLQNGANVNYQDMEGRTALIVAIENANLEIVKILLKAGADPRLVQEQGEDALTIAKNELIFNEEEREETQNEIDELNQELNRLRSAINQKTRNKKISIRKEEINRLENDLSQKINRLNYYNIEIQNLQAIIELLTNIQEIPSPIQYQQGRNMMELSGRTGRRGGHILHYDEKSWKSLFNKKL